MTEKDFLDDKLVSMRLKDFMIIGFKDGLNFYDDIKRFNAYFDLIEGLDADPSIKLGLLNGLKRDYTALMTRGGRYDQGKNEQLRSLINRYKALNVQYDVSKGLEQRVEEPTKAPSESSLLFKIRRDGSMGNDDFAIDIEGASKDPIELPFNPDDPMPGTNNY